MVGIVSLREALNMARESNLDLVEVSPNANPPVCRIMDYGKFLYDRDKRERKARKAQKNVEVKEIRLSPKIGEHDIDFRVRDARKWLEDGLKVRVRVRFRGREITYPEIGRTMLQQVAERLSDVSVIENSPRMEGRTMLMILSPNTKN